MDDQDGSTVRCDGSQAAADEPLLVEARNTIDFSNILPTAYLRMYVCSGGYTPTEGRCCVVIGQEVEHNNSSHVPPLSHNKLLCFGERPLTSSAITFIFKIFSVFPHPQSFFFLRTTLRVLVANTKNSQAKNGLILTGELYKKSTLKAPGFSPNPEPIPPSIQRSFLVASHHTKIPFMV